LIVNAIVFGLFSATETAASAILYWRALVLVQNNELKADDILL
jgi:hypothetical protein